MSEDQRKWNVPRCAKEIRGLQSRLEALEGGRGEVSTPTHIESDTPYPEFQAWQQQGMLDLIHSSGADSVSWKRLHHATSMLAAAWGGLMLSRGATYDEVKAFMDWSNEKVAYVHKFQDFILAGRRSRVVNAVGGEGQVNVAEKPEVAVSAVASENRNLYAEFQATGAIKVPDEE